MPGLQAQLRRLKEAGFRLILVTNQSGVGKGLMTLAELEALHARMQAALGAEALDAIYYCPHHPDAGCLCRKPAPALIQRACAEHNLDARRSFMLGDEGRDIEMGRAAGCLTILCRTHLSKLVIQPLRCPPDFQAQTLGEAVDWILKTSHG